VGLRVGESVRVGTCVVGGAPGVVGEKEDGETVDGENVVGEEVGENVGIIVGEGGVHRGG